MQPTQHFSVYAPMHPNRYEVRTKVQENHDTVTLGLMPLSAADHCTQTPGQFNMLYLFGTGELPISVSRLPNTEGTLWHTIRGVGPVSQKCLTLEPGDMVGVRGGFGVGWPMEAAVGQDIILVAGGIGLAPLRPVIDHVLANHSDFGTLNIIYGARSPADQIFLDELAQWHSNTKINFISTVDHATGQWPGQVGVVTDAMSQLDCTAANTIAMLCGPEIMMHFSVLTLEKLGISTKNIYVSMERSMKCAIGHCGHCQWAGDFMCKDGPVFRFSDIATRFRVSGL